MDPLEINDTEREELGIADNEEPCWIRHPQHWASIEFCDPLWEAMRNTPGLHALIKPDGGFMRVVGDLVLCAKPKIKALSGGRSTQAEVDDYMNFVRGISSNPELPTLKDADIPSRIKSEREQNRACGIIGKTSHLNLHHFLASQYEALDDYPGNVGGFGWAMACAKAGHFVRRSGQSQIYYFMETKSGFQIWVDGMSGHHEFDRVDMVAEDWEIVNFEVTNVAKDKPTTPNTRTRKDFLHSIDTVAEVAISDPPVGYEFMCVGDIRPAGVLVWNRVTHLWEPEDPEMVGHPVMFSNVCKPIIFECPEAGDDRVQKKLRKREKKLKRKYKDARAYLLSDAYAYVHCTTDENLNFMRESCEKYQAAARKCHDLTLSKALGPIENCN